MAEAGVAYGSMTWGLLCTSAAFWYFYGKRNVRAWYDRLERAA